MMRVIAMITRLRIKSEVSIYKRNTNKIVAEGANKDELFSYDRFLTYKENDEDSEYA